MKRREFITLLGGAAMSWPLIARGQQPAMPVIGFLHQGSPEPNVHVVDAFRRGLQETGFIKDRNVMFEFRWANGEYNRLPALANDLVRRQPAVIAAALLPAAQAAKAASATIPIVFISGSDPIEAGLVTSLNRPAENVTGVSLFAVPLIAKRLELLHELVPGTTAVAVLINPANPNAESNMRDITAAGHSTGLHIEFIKASGEQDFDAAFSTISQQRASALIISADGFFASRRAQLVALSARVAVPTMYFQREFVDAGGLISYGTSSPDMYRQAGIYTGKILKGAKPAELPIEQPTKFELAINRKTSRALGLEIPPMLLAIADEVIE
jgi:putative tryptophan/tyrosine transport system substrate-binding protein